MSDTNKNVNLKLKIQAENKELKNLRKELATLKKQFADVQRVGKEYANSTDGLNRKLKITKNQIETSNKLYETQKSKVKNCQGEIKRLKNEIAGLTAKYGANDPVVKNAIKNLEKQKEILKRSAMEMQTTKNSVDMLTEAEKRLGQSVAIANFKEKNARLKEQGELLVQQGNKLKAFGDSADKLGSTMLRIGVPILGVGTAATKMAIQYESAFAGVRKTTDATEQEYKKLSDSILEMTTRLPKSANEIANVMEMAGQLGVAKGDLLQFTETMIKLGDTTNLSANDAAVALARFTNVAHTSKEDIGRLGSVIVDLGNNTATTEAEIVNMASRIVGTGYQIGMTEPQIMGLAATLSSLGIEAEAGGSAISKLMSKMQLAVAEGGGALENFAKVSNMSSEEFKKAFKENASGAIASFVKGLDNIKKNGGDVISTLTDMGLSEVRLKDTILKLSSGSDQLNTNIALSNKAWKENIALTKESNKRYETTESKIQILKNKFSEQAIQLGTELLPTLTEFMQGITKLMQKFNELDPSVKKSIINFGLITTVMGGVLKVVSPLTSGLGGLFKILGKSKLSKFNKELVDVATSGTTASGILGTVGSKISGAVASVGGLGGAVTAALPLIGGLVAVGGALYTGVKMIDGATENANKTILTTKENMSFWGRVMAKVSGNTIYTNEQLENMHIKFKGVKDASKEFNEQLKSTVFDVQQFGFELNQISLDKVMSDDEINGIVGRVNGLVEKIKQKIEENNTGKSLVAEMFKADGVLDDTEKTVLESMDKLGEKQKKKVEEIQKQIGETLERIKNEQNGKAQQADILFLKQKYDELAKLQMELESNNQKELQGLKERWYQELNTLDIEQASEYIKREKETTEKALTEIRGRYDAAIEELKKTLPQVDEEQQKAIKLEIERLEDNKQKALGKEREKYQGFIDVIKEKYPEIAKEIDLHNGQIMTEQEKWTQKMLERYSKNYIGEIAIKTGEGMQLIQDETNGHLSAIYTIYDDKTGDIVGVYDFMSGRIRTNNEELKKSFEEKRDKLDECTRDEREYMKELQEKFYSGKMDITTYNQEMNNSFERLKNKIKETKDTGDLFTNTTFRTNFDGSQALSDLRQINAEFAQMLRNSSNANDRKIGAKWGTKQGYSFLYTGTTFADGGLAEINEQGWELFSDRNYRDIFNPLVRSKTAFLPRGARVTNHLNSVAMMREDITKEVRRQISNINFSNPYFTRHSTESRTFINNVNSSVTTNNNSINSNDLINAIVMAIELGFKKVKFEPNIEVMGDKKDYDLGYELAMLNKQRGY